MTSLPQLYVRVILKFLVNIQEMIQCICKRLMVEPGSNEDDIRHALEQLFCYYYSMWPNPQSVSPSFQQLLFEFVRHIRVNTHTITCILQKVHIYMCVC